MPIEEQLAGAMNDASINNDDSASDDRAAEVMVRTPHKKDASRSAGSSTWSRTMLNFWLDATMLIVFVLMIWSATIVRFVFPPALAARGWTLWSWNLDQWIAMQFAATGVFTFLIILHLMLHWTWICGVVTSRLLRRADGRKRTVDDGTRTLWGVGLLILLLNLMGVGIALAVLMIQGPH
jgi:hypothetical protein